ncbi:site-specific integrase [Nonomuraea longispora]|uniref:Site-specific integrase n=1 Tax=Nonomuraea longispora TaxID=1848320 RepID=A0A4V2XK49_9ACTN|nr:site-specific integrase [Nonomuraea longispora]TDC05076.1 site-specific integrase [Nonomuraea longispora]
MTARSLLPLYTEQPDRAGRDRLEILTALITSPTFDPIYRTDIIKIPLGHPVYRWECVVEDCERARTSGTEVCSIHRIEWVEARARGMGKAEFLTAAEPLGPVERSTGEPCRICPGRPAIPHGALRLCRRHHYSWTYYFSLHDSSLDLETWVADQEPCEGYGRCQVRVCPGLAESPLGLCSWHRARYKRRGRPGGAALPSSWWQSYENLDLPVPVFYSDEAAFRAWCASTDPMPRPGQINLLGLRPLLRAEIKWTLFAHTQHDRHSRWDLDWIQRMANRARERDAGSLTDLDLADFPRFHGAIVKTMLHHLRLIYFTPMETREAGFIETDHFGIRFPFSASHVDLTAISQRWLRDLAWDYLASLFSSPRCPRTRVPVDQVRRAATELSAFLEIEAPDAGHDPRRLTIEHAQRFIADQRRREGEGLPSLAMKGSDGKPSIVSSNTRSVVANGIRKLLRDALEDGSTDRLGLDREFITAMPAAGGAPMRARRPFPDEVARALADETNLAMLAETFDSEDRGLRDVWETIVITGRRVNEVLRLRWDCIGRYGGLAMFWHDQSKVGNYDAAIRIPERLYDVLAARQRKTLDRFTAQHGRRPSGEERAGLALFFSSHRNRDGKTSLSYQWFHRYFRQWLDGLDLGHFVPHQARHTLATNLLRHGASLTHIRRYLGQVSERMAEHYVHLSHSDLENVLQHVWVAGPGTASPGELLGGEAAAPLTREEAQAIAVDLARRSTPAEGGFCTFQPVVDGGACPWKLDCHNCDKFVLSGADLLYWRRKREQWRLLAEGAPDDATATYLHAYFEPTARAIDGLEKALAGLGLLDDALALDLRKPQDYFQRVWSTAFLASDLAAAGDLVEVDS